MTMTSNSKEDESHSQCTTVPSRTNSLPTSISEYALEKTLEQLGNFPVEVSAMEEAGPLLRIIRRKLKMDAVLLVRGCVARRIFHSGSTSQRLMTPHHSSSQVHSYKVPLSSRFSQQHYHSNGYRHSALKRIHYFSDIQDYFDLLQSHAIKPLQESKISAFLTRRVKLDNGQVGTLVCASSTAGLFSTLTASEYDIVTELASAIEDIYFHREEQSFHTIRSHLALVNGLVLSLRNSLSDLNDSNFVVGKNWDELKMLFTHNDPKVTPRRAQSQLIGVASEQIDSALKRMQQTADVFCGVIERTMMVAKGYLTNNPAKYMQSCAVTNEQGFVSTFNQYLVRYSATLPRNMLLWTFKTENFFSTCSHVTYYHHLMLFLENVIFHWSAICSTVQLTIVFEDNSACSEEQHSFINRPRNNTLDDQENHVQEQISKTATESDSLSTSTSKPSFIPPPIIIPSETRKSSVSATPIARFQANQQTQRQNWQLSDRKGYDHRLVGNIVMTLQFSDEFGAEEMAFPMEIINQILSLLNSSLSRLSHESAVQIAPTKSMYQAKSEESYVIRVPCTMYFTDAMYENYDKNRRLKQQIKLKRDQTMRSADKSESLDVHNDNNSVNTTKSKYAGLRTPRFVRPTQNNDSKNSQQATDGQKVATHHGHGYEDNLSSNFVSRMKRMLGWSPRVGTHTGDMSAVKRNQDPHHFNHTPPSSKHQLMKEGFEEDNDSVFSNTSFYANKNASINNNIKSTNQQSNANNVASGHNSNKSDQDSFLSILPVISSSTNNHKKNNGTRNSLWGHLWQAKPLDATPSITITPPLTSDMVSDSNDTVNVDNNLHNDSGDVNNNGVSTSRKQPQIVANTTNNSNLPISMFASSGSPLRKKNRVEPSTTAPSTTSQQDPNSISTTRIV